MDHLTVRHHEGMGDVPDWVFLHAGHFCARDGDFAVVGPGDDEAVDLAIGQLTPRKIGRIGIAERFRQRRRLRIS